MSKNFLNITILPYRSLSKKGFKYLMFTVAFIFFSIGVFFWYLGAWPVFGFIGLDVILLYLAFKINYKSGEIFENIRIFSKKFVVTRNFPSGKKQIWNLDPYWAKAEIVSPLRNQHNLIIKSKDKAVLIGSFLNHNDQKKLTSKIQQAINNYKLYYRGEI